VTIGPSTMGPHLGLVYLLLESLSNRLGGKPALQSFGRCSSLVGHSAHLNRPRHRVLTDSENVAFFRGIVPFVTHRTFTPDKKHDLVEYLKLL